MKKLALMALALFVVGVLLAPMSPLLAAGKTHDMKGEIVSVDLDGKTLTFKDEAGENHTAPVMGKALATFKNVKAGDKVTVTCTDNEKGEHLGISAIKIGKAEGK